MVETGEGGRWLSYAELAEVRSMTVPSAIRYVRKKKWPKQPANDGTIRVLVPPGALDARKPRPVAAPEGVRAASLPEALSDRSGTIKALEAALAAVKEHLEREKAGADHARRTLELGSQIAAEERAHAAAERARLEKQIEVLQAQLTASRSQSRNVKSPTWRGRLARWLRRGRAAGKGPT